MAALHRFAKLTAGCTLLLIAAGGLVTSTGSALSVPDWPLSFGKILPPMTGGVVFEHSHRMIAGGVGILAAILGIWLWRREPRRWVRRLGGAAVLVVVAQAVLGGVTVLMRLPLLVSVAHACMAQVFFCLVVTLALVTSEGWTSPGPPPRPLGGWPGLPSLSVSTTGFLFLQLFLGALVRHTGSGLAIPDFPLAFGRFIPPVLEGQVLIAYFHRLGAVVAGIYVLWTAGRILLRHRNEPLLVRPASALVSLMLLQVVLGGLVVWSGLAVIPATAHVVTGALLLATSLVVALRACRLAGGFRGAESVAAAPAQGSPISPSWAVR